MWPQLRSNRIRFGIDLVGGSYITLEVQTDKAIEAELADKLKLILRALKKDQYEVPVSQKIEDLKINLGFSSIDEAVQVMEIIKKVGSDLIVEQVGNVIVVSLSQAEMEKIRTWAVQGNIEVLRTRLDAIGVGEITIAAQGEKNIIVELPDVSDPEQAKTMIGKPAMLEFKVVEGMAHDEDELLDEYDGELPDDLEIISSKEDRELIYYLVSKFSDLTGRQLKDARAGLGSNQYQNEMVVNIEFDANGARKFYELTRDNPGKHIAMIVDDVVISAPRFPHEPIEGGKAFIHGNFTTETAKELGMLLKSGAFVAPVTFEEERQIGPSLGMESIQNGLIACGISLVLLSVFSIIIYSLSGFFAFLALLYNLVLVFFMLSLLGATLTLPGIAGMVLTVGMAIDASILIYEKIKEELAGETSIRKAVASGFSDAMTVILDSNITTFLVGIVLYKFGTGAIQGFAVTMMVGIVATLITGLFFLRSIFEIFFTLFDVQKLKI